MTRVGQVDGARTREEHIPDGLTDMPPSRSSTVHEKTRRVLHASPDLPLGQA